MNNGAWGTSRIEGEVSLKASVALGGRGEGRLQIKEILK